MSMRGQVSFLGVEAIRRQRQEDRPRTVERRRGLSPRIAAKNRARRVAALGRLKAFYEAYRAALSRWREGARDVVFPAGTYAMRVAHGAACVVLS